MTGSSGSPASPATISNVATTAQQQPTSAGRILDIAFAFRRSKALLAAVELGIFTRLRGDAMDCQLLAIEAGVSSRAARDFFDSLVALGVLDRDLLGRYFNTAEWPPTSIRQALIISAGSSTASIRVCTVTGAG